MLKRTWEAWYSMMASASVEMAESILEDQRRMLPCACLLNGHYGFEGLYMGVPAILGKTGVEEIVELPLTVEARALMQKTAGAIERDIETMREVGIL